MNLLSAAVPAFSRYLTQLLAMLDVAESHARQNALPAAALLEARLAPDMLPLRTQFEIAANFALRGCCPLAGQPNPGYGECPATFAGLRARLQHAQTLIEALQPAPHAAESGHLIEDQAGEALVRLPPADFLLQYALPNFVFHTSIAYAILRQHGVPLGKSDFDGLHAYPKLR